MPPRDVFICHASDDKNDLAKPLVAALGLRSISCWLDEAEIRLGDSLFGAINDGLRLADYVAVLVTEHFLAKEWTAKELAAAFGLEVARKRTVVLPVLAVDEHVWTERYPLLADKNYVTLGDGVEGVADAIARRFHRSPQVEWAFNHPHWWVGEIWTRVCRPLGSTETEAQLTMRWGPYVRQAVVQLDRGPVSLLHHKLHEDSVTLHVECHPPMIITFGQGESPDPRPRATTIDEGWTRAAGMPVDSPLPLLIEPLPRDRHDLAELLNPPTNVTDDRP